MLLHADDALDTEAAARDEAGYDAEAEDDTEAEAEPNRDAGLQGSLNTSTNTIMQRIIDASSVPGQASSPELAASPPDLKQLSTDANALLRQVS